MYTINGRCYYFQYQEHLGYDINSNLIALLEFAISPQFRVIVSNMVNFYPFSKLPHM